MVTPTGHPGPIITGKIPCEQDCTVPEGVALVQVPRPRHAWGDVFNCPNDGCNRSFMLKDVADIESQPRQ